MHEIGIESSLFELILDGQKTIEVRLGTPKHITFRVGDLVALREDIWDGDNIINEIYGRGTIKITQLLYFEALEELFGAVNYKSALPDAESKTGAIRTYRTYYSEADEYKYGVIAITFELV